MARPTKQGIDYFPLDCSFGPEMDLFIAESGMSGLGILISIWQFIYQNDGYYCDYDEKKFPLLIRKKTMAETGEIMAVVASAVDLGIFNISMFKKYSILTSRGIQNRFFLAAKQKKTVYINKNYICSGVSMSVNAINIDGNATKEEEEVKEKVNRMFCQFWEAYPNKKDKKKASAKYWLVYEKHDEIMSGLYKHIGCQEWTKDGGKYIPHPTTWLNGERWNDEVTTVDEPEDVRPLL